MRTRIGCLTLFGGNHSRQYHAGVLNAVARIAVLERHNPLISRRKNLPLVGASLPGGVAQYVGSSWRLRQP